MSQDLTLYELLLNIPNLSIESVDVFSQELHIYCYQRGKLSQECPSCGTQVSGKRLKYRRKVRDLDISGRKVILCLLVHQYSCDCGRKFSETFDFVDSGKSYTKRQAKWTFEMSAQQSHRRVGALLDICPKTVERMCYAYLGDREINWKQVKRIGIDEIAFRKGHKDFATVLVDLDTHELLDILEKRDKDFLRAYFQSLGKEFCAQVEDFCSDMWGPFQDLGKEIFPNANIHVDRFHWTVHLNKVLDNTRKELRREDKKEQVYKKLKWKLIKRPKTLTNQEINDLEKAFQLSPHLEEVYEMRNTFQAIFDSSFSLEFAKEQIQHWLEQAKMLKNKHLDKFIDLFERHQTNILNYFKNRISSGVVEGTNNLLRTVKRFTFNMTNFENFKCRVFAYKA